MTAINFIIAIIVLLAILYVIFYVIIPDIFKNKKEFQAPLDELEKESENIKERKSEIRSATDKTHKQIKKINDNLKN